MIYDTLNDMIIDNRNGLVKDIEHLSETDKDRVLSAFDWLATEYIKEYVCNGMLSDRLKGRYTEEEIKQIDFEVARNFRLLMVAEQKYYQDIENGHNVGYSVTDDSALDSDNTTSLMTLDDAIEHCKEKEDCSACGEEHHQLRMWLENYRFLCSLGEDMGRIRQLLGYEYECVSRQSGTHVCDRDCANCDLVQDDKELLQMYRKVMSVLAYLEQVHLDNMKLLSGDAEV